MNQDSVIIEIYIITGACANFYMAETDFRRGMFLAASLQVQAWTLICRLLYGIKVDSWSYHCWQKVALMVVFAQSYGIDHE
jgi:hypothetical protein